MNILVTGAKGFVGRNLVSQLHNIQFGKARNYPFSGEDIKVFEYDVDSDPEELEVYCQNADFVFNLAGVNRPLCIQLGRGESSERPGGIHERQFRFRLYVAGYLEEI